MIKELEKKRRYRYLEKLIWVVVYKGAIRIHARSWLVSRSQFRLFPRAKDLQQLPVINCSFWPAKIVWIRGLCDYPSIGPLIDEGDDQPILMVKLQPTEWNITRKERILPCSQLPADWPIWSILKLQFHMTAKTEDWCTLDTATMLHKYSNGHRVGIQTPYNLSILL